METTLVYNAVILLSVSILLVIICRLLRLPIIVSFLISGIIIGPYGLDLLHTSSGSGHSHLIESISELGIILLLFTLGIEFSLQKLKHIKRLIIFGGLGQISLTILLFSGIYYWLVNNSLPEAIFIGFLGSLSSTAIVMKYLQEKLEVDSPHGKASLGILICQDLFVILLILLIPFLGGQSSNITSILFPVLKALLLISLILLFAVKLVPKVLNFISRYRSNELFLLTIALVCLAISYLTSWLGLSLSIGAFLAGLAISESDYHDHALTLTIPFRDIFLSFFFVSIGMMLNIPYVLENIVLILGLLIIVFVIKSIIITSVIYSLKLPVRSSLLTGMFLCQIGEFAFILAKEGFKYNLLSEDKYQIFLAVAVLSMGLTPLLINLAFKITNILQEYNLIQDNETLDPELTCDLKNHLIIVGYGLNGRWVATVCKILGRPYIICEANSETVKKERAKGENIIYADASNTSIWQKININQAQAIVLAISDAQILNRVIKNIRLANKDVHIIVRTRFLSEHDNLRQLGVQDLICKDFESTLEVTRKVMDRFSVTQNAQDKIIDFVKQEEDPLRGLT